MLVIQFERRVQRASYGWPLQEGCTYLHQVQEIQSWLGHLQGHLLKNGFTGAAQRVTFKWFFFG